MKFTEGTYTITKTEDLLLRNRLQSLRQLLPKKTSIQLTLITTFGLQSNQYSNQVNQVIILETSLIDILYENCQNREYAYSHERAYSNKMRIKFIQLRGGVESA